VNNLYTFGYGGKDVPALLDLLATLEPPKAIVVDTRYRPYSRNPTWAKGNLLGQLDSQYLHLPELGNVNYKGEGDIKIADLDAGGDKVGALLQVAPVVLLCVCKDVQFCHRKVVGEALAERFGVDLIHLPVKAPKPAPEGGRQLSFLGNP
jgi:uncharacterized protein (DUF488 family)